MFPLLVVKAIAILSKRLQIMLKTRIKIGSKFIIKKKKMEQHGLDNYKAQN